MRLALHVSSLGALALPLGALAGCAHHPEMSYERRSHMLEALIKLVLPDAQPAQVLEDRSFVFRSIDRKMRGVTFAHLDALAGQLDEMSGGDFLELSPDRRKASLEAVDHQTFTDASPIAHPWYSIKAMIVIAYFTSSPGMEDTLLYDLVPGRYDPDIPVTPDFKPMSNDWSAVSIRKPLVSS
ncbi:gluconate 2-dehydrogenase subunit 3 family protein [Novosphingobium sp. 1949]|uniref:Gluconate 2-dehydrogenase subunit 3 family protein n=1 Tax=Novosphingobium organovorum TaxID=2930092 RepID=A0ABT0BC12_9SPHN|nr:gluconate 2-dehydrogenase subunit 3 family protein [Novosphingobium organovorum]MCJ2182445.1 gluconate 2-dehydrogenase subunit 3 family protein [Novosphingobium organovorum]